MLTDRERKKNPNWRVKGFHYFDNAIAEHNRDRLAGKVEPDGTRLVSIQQNTQKVQRAQHIEDFLAHDGLWLGSWGDKPSEAELAQHGEQHGGGP